MRVLYIGHYMPGCTSRMRGEYLNEILKPEEFTVIDTDIPVYKTPKLFLSFGWRFYRGPLIKNVNNYIRKALNAKKPFDLIWIDKGVFIDPVLLKEIKGDKSILVHFTPDTAFTANKSGLFRKGVPLYDYCISTKSFELDAYKFAGAKEVIYCTQGYDSGLHKIYYDFSEKEGVCFVGLNEPEREEIIHSLLEDDILVKLAGANWERFVKKHNGKPNLKWHGAGLFGPEYAKLISGSLMGLGLLSKNFPELHTTRTFEIPACGTLLVTEDNHETRKFYTNEDVVFFSDKKELPQKIKAALSDPARLQKMSKNGYNTVNKNHYDYKSIISDLLKKMNLLN